MKNDPPERHPTILSKTLPCEFMAAVIHAPQNTTYPLREREPGENGRTYVLPWRVEGRFLVHDGLAVVLHKGYGAEKDSPLLFVSEYTTGCLMVRGKRSEIFELLSKDIARLVEGLGGIDKVRDMYRRYRGYAGPKNSACLPKDYLLS